MGSQTHYWLQHTCVVYWFPWWQTTLLSLSGPHSQRWANKHGRDKAGDARKEVESRSVWWWKFKVHFGCRERGMVIQVEIPCVYVGPGGRFKSVYELLNLRALKILMLYQNEIFQSMGQILFVWNFKGYLWNSTWISYPYIERYYFIQHWNFKSSWI